MVLLLRAVRVLAILLLGVLLAGLGLPFAQAAGGAAAPCAMTCCARGGMHTACAVGGAASSAGPADPANPAKICSWHCDRGTQPAAAVPAPDEAGGLPPAPPRLPLPRATAASLHAPAAARPLAARDRLERPPA
jgi:hypothetical protein